MEQLIGIKEDFSFGKSLIKFQKSAKAFTPKITKNLTKTASGLGDGIARLGSKGGTFIKNNKKTLLGGGLVLALSGKLGSGAQSAVKGVLHEASSTVADAAKSTLDATGITGSIKDIVIKTCIFIVAIILFAGVVSFIIWGFKKILSSGKKPEFIPQVVMPPPQNEISM